MKCEDCNLTHWGIFKMRGEKCFYFKEKMGLNWFVLPEKSWTEHDLPCWHSPGTILIVEEKDE